MAFTGVTIDIKADGTMAVRALDMVQDKLKQTRSHVESEGGAIAKVMERIGEVFSAVALYEVAREALEGLKELTIGSFELGESMENASNKTGLAVETLSVLKYAANVTNVDFDTLTGAVAKMDGTIASATQGNKKAAATLQSLGLDAKTLAGNTRGAEIAFKALGEKIAATENPIRRVELAKNLLGKQGADMIPMLMEVGNGWDDFVAKAKKAGVFLTTEQAHALADTNQRLDDLKQNVIGAGLAFSGGLTPGVQGLLDTIAAGKGSLDAIREFGETASRGIIFLTSAVSGLSKELVQFKSGVTQIDLGIDKARDQFGAEHGLTAGARAAAAKQLQQDTSDYNMAAIAASEAQESFNATSDRLNKQLNALDQKPTAAAAKGPKTRKPGGFDGIGDQSKVAAPKSDDPIVRAAAQLVEEQAKAQSDAQKQATQAMLAELETQHKMLLVTDTDYYQEKLRLQVAALEAEKTALDKQGAELDSLLKKQQGDKLLKRDKNGNSAEELRTQREILQVQERIGEVQAKSQALGSQSNADVYAAGQARELAGLRQAADLERERDSGIAARLALLQRETELQAQQVANAGGGTGDVAQARQLGEIAAQKLRIAEVDRQIRDSEQDNRRAVEELNDAAAKDPRLKTAAAREINRLNADEARQLAVLVQQYDELAATLGGDFLAKAKDLHAELDKLNRPDNKEDAAFTKTLVEGIEGLGNKMITTAGEGKNAFHDMAKSIEKDLLALALKLAEERFITPMLPGALGGGGGNLPVRPTFGTGISAQPQTQGGGGILASLGQAVGLGGAAQGGAPKVILNITNTGSPVAATQTGSSYNADAKEFVVHAVLENAGAGGLLSHLFGGGK